MISSQENLSALTTAESRTPKANKIHKDLVEFPWWQLCYHTGILFMMLRVLLFKSSFFVTPCLQHSFPLSSHLITSTVYIYKHACTLKKKAKQHRKVKIELTGLSRVQFQNLYRVFMRLHVFISHTFYSKFMCKWEVKKH